MQLSSAETSVLMRVLSIRGLFLFTFRDGKKKRQNCTRKDFGAKGNQY